MTRRIVSCDISRERLPNRFQVKQANGFINFEMSFDTKLKQRAMSSKLVQLTEMAVSLWTFLGGVSVEATSLTTDFTYLRLPGYWFCSVAEISAAGGYGEKSLSELGYRKCILGLSRLHRGLSDYNDLQIGCTAWGPRTQDQFGRFCKSFVSDLASEGLAKRSMTFCKLSGLLRR